MSYTAVWPLKEDLCQTPWMEECISIEIERNNRGKSGLKCGAYDIDTCRVISYSLIKQIVKKKKYRDAPSVKRELS